MNKSPISRMRRKPDPKETILRALKQRDLTVHEARLLLERKNFSAEAPAVVDYFCQIGLLNDLRIAEAVVYSNQGRAAVGDLRLVHKLSLRGISAEVIERALEKRESTELERAQVIVGQKFDGVFDEKAQRFLWSRGYCEETIDSLRS